MIGLVLLPILCAPAAYILGRRKTEYAQLSAAAVSAAALALALLVLLRQPGEEHLPAVLPGGLCLRTDGFRGVYCVLAALLWLCTTLFGREYFRDEREGIPGYWCFVLLTLGATEGLFLSADFATAFCFFEILSLSSFPWVAQEREEEAVDAAKTYLAVAVIGGLVLLMGLWMLRDAAGTLDFDALSGALTRVPSGKVRTAGVFILLGFGAKAGMFPLHIWLPKAHPVAPAPASALLSGMLTKVGVFGILQLVLHAVWGDRAFGLFLLALAVVTMALGAVLAVFSPNLKRTLACSSMSQIGFVLTGLAVRVLAEAAGDAHAAELALNGAFLHMVNHSLFKLLLFLCAGAAAMNLHALRLEDVQGWGRNKPLLMICFALGALGIGGVPGLNGYISKTLLHEGLAHLISDGGPVWFYRASEILFLFSGGLTFAYMLRLFVCVFVEPNRDPLRQARYNEKAAAYLTPLSAAVLTACALFLLPLGVPGVATALGGFMSGGERVHLAAFAWENLKGALISIGTGAAVYLGFIRPFLCTGRISAEGWFSLERDFYRPLLTRWLPAVLGVPARLLGENLILRRLPVSVPVGAARMMGENVVLRYAAKTVTAAAGAVGRLLDESLDALTLLLSRTVLREERVRNVKSLLRVRRLRPFRRATLMAFSQVADNFSFAMMMLCAGIILIFAMLIVILLGN